MMLLDSWYQQIPYPLVTTQAIDPARLYFPGCSHVASSRVKVRVRYATTWIGCISIAAASMG
jgi:hypothetical protein